MYLILISDYIIVWILDYNLPADYHFRYPYFVPISHHRNQDDRNTHMSPIRSDYLINLAGSVNEWSGNNRQHIRVDDIFKIADLSVSYGLQKLVIVAIDSICKRLKELEASEEFLKSGSMSLLEMLLGQPHFSEAKEEELLETVVVWLSNG